MGTRTQRHRVVAGCSAPRGARVEQHVPERPLWCVRSGRLLQERGRPGRVQVIPHSSKHRYNPAAFLPVTPGREVVLGKEGGTAELPCQASRRNNVPFTWKHLDHTKILGSQNSYLVHGNSYLKSRSDSKKTLWDQGSFILIISKLEMKDSGTYICEVEGRRTEVELQVFALTATPGPQLLQGQDLTLTLQGPPGSNPSVQFKGRRNEAFSGVKHISVPKLEPLDSGVWTCTVSVERKTLLLDINISVLGLQKRSVTLYKKEGEEAEFSFPLTSGDPDLSGELRWRTDRAASSQSWITFSLENKKVSVQKATQDPKLEMAETPPLRLMLAQPSLHHAGSGNLTLTLAKGQLQQEVNLVVMRVTQREDHLVCEVQGPTSPKLTLSLKLENQKTKVSTTEKTAKVQSPEAGVWLCLLSDGNQDLLESKFEAVAPGLIRDQSMFLVVTIVGGGVGLLLLAGILVFCCVRSRHRQTFTSPLLVPGQRRAERMSQIKRLLSEKKTCQCSQ
ncbi:T-cell surface glycoprotein CD4 [Ctenodactylus gundi]